MELCVLAENVPEGNNSLLNTAIWYIACHLDKVSASDVARLSYKMIQLLVQSEDITSTELVLFSSLNQWTNVLSQMKQLYSHICFGHEHGCTVSSAVVFNGCLRLVCVVGQVL